MRFTPVLLGFALAVSLAACTKTNEIDEETANFRPPTAQPREDFARALDSRFGRIDRNSDGAVQADEMQPRRAADAGAGQANVDRGGRRVANLKALDADGDGEVTRSEFVNGSLARFDKADANHDKILTSDERRASGLFGQRDGDNSGS